MQRRWHCANPDFPQHRVHRPCSGEHGPGSHSASSCQGQSLLHPGCSTHASKTTISHAMTGAISCDVYSTGGSVVVDLFGVTIRRFDAGSLDHRVLPSGLTGDPSHGRSAGCAFKQARGCVFKQDRSTLGCAPVSAWTSVATTWQHRLMFAHQHRWELRRALGTDRNQAGLARAVPGARCCTATRSTHSQPGVREKRGWHQSKLPPLQDARTAWALPPTRNNFSKLVEKSAFVMQKTLKCNAGGLY